MRKHTLKKAPGYELTYSVISPVQIQTRDQEPVELGIEISDIHIRGNRVSDVDFSRMMRANRVEWVSEIIEALKREKYDVRQI